MSRTYIKTTALVAGLAVAPGAAAQVAPPPADSGTMVEVVPGEHYRGNALLRLLVGQNYRSLWLRPLTVPVLDLDRFAGGLEVEKAGGNQSRTLHFTSPDGRTWIFRSVDKFTGQTLPEDLEGTVINDIVQDYISALHPGGAFVAEPLARAAGLLAVTPVLRIMPDDPALGEHREKYAGLLGQMVERPNEGEDDEPLYGGFNKIVGSDEVLDKLEDDPRHRVDTREFLTGRLLDFVVGDPDRGLDQWRWARVPDERGFRWRPIVRDRDWAFIHSDGPLTSLVATVYPKIVKYGPEFASLESMTWGDQGLSRVLITDLDRAEWDQVVERLQRALTDDVIDQAVAGLPAPQRADHAEWLAHSLRARRDALPSMAADFYALLATDVDIKATDRSDRAEITRARDGSLDVTLFGRVEHMVATEIDDDEDDEDDENDENGNATPRFEEPGWVPYYNRRFLPAETQEVRVFMQGGDDLAVVRGTGPGDITVRVIGGGGDDQLMDTSPYGHAVAFYDARGDNRFETRPRTRVSTRDFEVDTKPGDWVQHEIGSDRHRDWGSEQSWLTPAGDYREGAGIILGAGPTWTNYGFRHRPYASRVELRGLYATGSAGFGVDLDADVKRENSRVSYQLEARATQFEAVRFYGYGNDTPRLDPDLTLVMQDRVRVAPALVVTGDAWEVAAGPVALYTDPRPPEGGPAGVAAPLGSGSFGQAGGLASLDIDFTDGPVPTRGLHFTAEATAYPGIWDAPDAFGRAGGELRGYLTAPVGNRPTLALRVGGLRAWGPFPIHDAAMIGGGSTLRGYRWQRFAGDAAAYGGAELRLPLFRMELLTKGRLGVLGLADAGRVYVDGESPGGWHTAYGAGLWFATLGQAVHATWARGEEDRYYIGIGLPF